MPTWWCVCMSWRYVLSARRSLVNRFLPPMSTRVVMQNSWRSRWSYCTKLGVRRWFQMHWWIESISMHWCSRRFVKSLHLLSDWVARGTNLPIGLLLGCFRKRLLYWVSRRQVLHERKGRELSKGLLLLWCLSTNFRFREGDCAVSDI